MDEQEKAKIISVVVVLWILC